MTKGRRHGSRLLAVGLIGIIALGLVAWELWHRRATTDRAPRQAAVILDADRVYPSELYVVADTDYRIAWTTTTDVVALRAAKDEQPVTVGPGRVTWTDVSASELQDGRPLGEIDGDGVGPVVRVVDDLSTLGAQGVVYPVAVIATETGLVPRQVRLPELIRTAVAGISFDKPRLLRVEGAHVHFPMWPDGVAEMAFDVAAPGTYTLVCEDGCADGGWEGSFRSEASASSIPWVEEASTAAAAELGRRAPDFILYDDEGRVVQLSDFVGRAPVMVNFWATWCPPCRREMPAMQQLYDRRGDEFELLAVNYLEHRDLVQDFMGKLGLDFPALMDVTGRTAERYNVRSYPTTIFIDATGTVQGRFVGELSPEMMEFFVDAITEDAS